MDNSTGNLEVVDNNNVSSGSENFMSNELEAQSKESTEKVYPKVKTNILFKHGNSDEWKKGYIHSRAGKATGIHQAKFNIQDHVTKDINFYDFDTEIAQWLPVPNEVMVTTSDKEAKSLAKLKELESWKKNSVYTEVEDHNQHAKSTR